jgi:Cu/Ag efflux protein CusF
LKLNRIALGIVSIFVALIFAGVTFSAEKMQGIKMAAGQVKAINAKTKTITIGNDKSGDAAYVVDDRTLVRANNKTGSFADIKVGDIAALVYYDVNGKNMVKSITVLSRAAASHSSKKP